MFATHAAEFLERYAIHAVLIVPMIAFGEVVGTLGVVRLDSDDPYGDDDIVVLEALAERAALALDRRCDAKTRSCRSARVRGDLPPERRRDPRHAPRRPCAGGEPGRVRHPPALRGRHLPPRSLRPARPRRSVDARRPVAAGTDRQGPSGGADGARRRRDVHRGHVVDDLHRQRRCAARVRDLPRRDPSRPGTGAAGDTASVPRTAAHRHHGRQRGDGRGGRDQRRAPRRRDVHRLAAGRRLAVDRQRCARVDVRLARDRSGPLRLVPAADARRGGPARRRPRRHGGGVEGPDVGERPLRATSASC